MPKTIGILGGAGPLAGACMLQRVLSLSGSLYGCHKDADFPKVIFLNFPFSEMLEGNMNVNQLKKELKQSLNLLRQNGASILAIACNTLHAFLDKDDLSNLISLPQSVADNISSFDSPLVLCTSTSVKFGLYRKFISCEYPDLKTQAKVDQIIDLILKGSDPILIQTTLLQIISNLPAKTVILGCTELSLYARHLSSANKKIIDPLEIVATKLLEQSFLNKK